MAALWQNNGWQNYFREDGSIILPNIILPTNNSVHTQAAPEGRQNDVRLKTEPIQGSGKFSYL
jgi:hypothetical protein